MKDKRTEALHGLWAAEGQDAQPQGHGSCRLSPVPQRHPKAHPHLPSTPKAALSPPCDGCQMLYPSREEMHLRAWPPITGHTAASLGCERSPTDLVLLHLSHSQLLGPL